MPSKYRPSNGTEGDIFMGKWCAECACHSFDEDSEVLCPILGNVMAFSVDDPEYPSEWTYNDKGDPICTAFKYEGDEETYRCEHTIDMFGGEV